MNETIDGIAVPHGPWIGSGTVAALQSIPVIDPATGNPVGSAGDSAPAHADMALTVAVDAQRQWCAMSPRHRAEVLRAAYDLLCRHSSYLAAVITAEMGKPLTESRNEVRYGADYFRWYGEQAARISSYSLPSSHGGGFISVQRIPVGPVLAITPWNFPFAMAARKVAPALAAGCPVIVKPAETTPLSALLLARLLADAGVPAGLVSVLPTSRPAELTGAFLGDQRLRKLTFTGSTHVGKLLIRQAADLVIRTSMELGGNAALVVLDDADLHAAVEGTVAAKFRNAGQACTAANRILVQRDIAEHFTELLVQRIAELNVGPGTNESTDIGPLATAAQHRKVCELVTDAIAHGAQLRTGGSPRDGAGWFYPPTVLDQVPASARLTREEIFGPVAAISAFDTDDDAVRLVNSTEFGLAHYVFGRSADRLDSLAAAFDAGMVGVNRGVISDAAAPFGGVKQSGYGREGGPHGLDDFLEDKYVATP